jgi:hypothetical protein
VIDFNQDLAELAEAVKDFAEPLFGRERIVTPSRRAVSWGPCQNRTFGQDLVRPFPFLQSLSWHCIADTLGNVIEFGTQQ